MMIMTRLGAMPRPLTEETGHVRSPAISARGE